MILLYYRLFNVQVRMGMRQVLLNTTVNLPQRRNRISFWLLSKESSAEWIQQTIIVLGESDLFIPYVQPSLHGSLLQ